MTGERATISRRVALKGAALAGMAAGTAGLAEVAQAARRVRTLVVFDSALPESAAFAAGQRSDARIDVAEGHASRWQGFRGTLPAAGTVEGLTGWGDWTGLRGELEARGYRVIDEMPVDAALSGKAHLFRWSMKAR